MSHLNCNRTLTRFLSVATRFCGAGVFVMGTTLLLQVDQPQRGAFAASPPLSDVVQRVDEKKYEVKIDLHVEAYQSALQAEVQYEMNLKDTPIVFPIVPDGGFHEVDMDNLKTELRLDDRVADASFELFPTSSLETQLGRFVIKEFKGKQIDLHFEEIVTSYASKVDEKTALQIGWPESWPPEVQSALQAQMWIDPDNEYIVKALEKFTGPNPKNLKPYLLAKYLAKSTVEYYQPTGTATSRDKHGNVDGFDVTGAENAVKKARGSWHDAVCLYVALCRAADIPARPVLGIDFRKGKDRGWISWAEIYLPTAGWVPVDLHQLYDSRGQMHQLERAWDGFGTDQYLNERIPIAHHFFPPAGVIGGGLKSKPLLWGWIPTPEHTPNNQRLVVSVQFAPNRGGAKKNRRRPRR